MIEIITLYIFYIPGCCSWLNTMRQTAAHFYENRSLFSVD